MDLRDITRESGLLKSYKSVFVDNQSYELIKAYPDHQDSFPVFADRIFSTSTQSTPPALIDYRLRKNLDKQKYGRIFILERTDNPSQINKTRLFWAWVSPKLIARWSAAPPDSVSVSASVLFHPFGNLDKYPSYWKGDIDPVKVPNYLELGARYLCKEKDTVLQHLCALRPPAGPTQGSGLEDADSKLDLMVVVPVSSPSSFTNLSSPVELEDALREVARRCFEGVSGKLLGSGPPTLARVAVSGYSRSGAILQNLFADTRKSEDFFRQRLKEVYTFDVMLDEVSVDPTTKVKTVTKTKQQGYDTLWANLKAWQGSDSDKKIRLYSAEPGTVTNVYRELTSRLRQYGGGYHNPSVKFSSFNGTRMPSGTATYTNLTDGYEIYSTDNSRSLVVLPSGNPLVYLSTENIQNAGGFSVGGDYAPNLEGHSWFVSRLFSHALYHSGF